MSVFFWGGGSGIKQHDMLTSELLVDQLAQVFEASPLCSGTIRIVSPEEAFLQEVLQCARANDFCKGNTLLCGYAPRQFRHEFCEMKWCTVYKTAHHIDVEPDGFSREALPANLSTRLQSHVHFHLGSARLPLAILDVPRLKLYLELFARKDQQLRKWFPEGVIQLVVAYCCGVTNQALLDEAQATLAGLNEQARMHVAAPVFQESVGTAHPPFAHPVHQVSTCGVL